MNEEDDEVEGSRRSLPMEQIKISIQSSFHDIVLLWMKKMTKESTHETNKDKYSIIILMVLFCYAFVYIRLMCYAW